MIYGNPTISISDHGAKLDKIIELLKILIEQTERPTSCGPG